jgi:hypothetical protein
MQYYYRNFLLIFSYVKQQQTFWDLEFISSSSHRNDCLTLCQRGTWQAKLVAMSHSVRQFTALLVCVVQSSLSICDAFVVKSAPARFALVTNQQSIRRRSTLLFSTAAECGY